MVRNRPLWSIERQGSIQTWKDRFHPRPLPSQSRWGFEGILRLRRRSRILSGALRQKTRSCWSLLLKKRCQLWRIISICEFWTSGESRTLEKIFLSILESTSHYKLRNSRRACFLSIGSSERTRSKHAVGRFPLPCGNPFAGPSVLRLDLHVFWFQLIVDNEIQSPRQPC